MRLTGRVRLHILTGFLGSGKSTLLRRYLHSGSNTQRVAVLINEFGSIAIDHTIVRAFSNHSRALAGGCACCDGDEALRACLLDTLRQIVSGELDGVEDIVLETSGVSDPSRIFGTIAAEMHLAEYIDIASCVTVLEAGSDDAFVDRFPELQNQIASASRIIISKADLQPVEATRATVALAQRRNPLAEVIVIDEHTALDKLFAKTEVPKHIPALPREHGSSFETFQVALDPRLSWPEFSVWLTAVLHCHGERILRFKGVIALNDSSSQALVLQGVRHRVYEPEHLDIDPAKGDAHFGLVFICAGAMQSLVSNGLRAFTNKVAAINSPSRSVPDQRADLISLHEATT
jgi:G3E family GTPase